MKKGDPIIVQLGIFSSEHHQIEMHNVHGIFESIDEDTQYINWMDNNGNNMPTVHINCLIK